jgi:hypothetical protein
MNIAVVAKTLPEKAAETLFFTAAAVRKQAKVFEGGTPNWRTFLRCCHNTRAAP